MELIDKAALVAEIQKLYDKDYPYLPSNIYELKDDLLAIIDELEVKEVDLTNEISKWLEQNCDNAGYFNQLEFARYFFELGFKMNQKGE